MFIKSYNLIQIFTVYVRLLKWNCFAGDRKKKLDYYILCFSDSNYIIGILIVDY